MAYAFLFNPIAFHIQGHIKVIRNSSSHECLYSNPMYGNLVVSLDFSAILFIYTVSFKCYDTQLLAEWSFYLSGSGKANNIWGRDS